MTDNHNNNETSNSATATDTTEMPEWEFDLLHNQVDNENTRPPRRVSARVIINTPEEAAAIEVQRARDLVTEWMAEREKQLARVRRHQQITDDELRDFTTLLVLFVQQRTELGQLRPDDIRTVTYGLSMAIQAVARSQDAVDASGDVSSDSLLYALLDKAEHYRELSQPQLRTAADIAVDDTDASRIMWLGGAAITRSPEAPKTNDSSSQYFTAQEMFVPMTPVPTGTYDELMGQLKALTGLGGVKESVEAEGATLRCSQARAKLGLKVSTRSRHMIFRGNPGTGKTTVARLIAGIYRSMGILENTEMVEVDRSGLVAQWIGKTALRVNDVVDNALGGVLFIDEAHALAGNGHDHADRFAQEAVDVLVKRMEDDRDDVVIILAGYPKEMDRLVAMNPGLESRIGITIDFEDYSDEELLAILRDMFADNDYDLAVSGEAIIKDHVAWAIRGPSFGNARAMRNVFDATTRAQSRRLSPELDTASVADLRAICDGDVTAAVAATLPQARPVMNTELGGYA